MEVEKELNHDIISNIMTTGKRIDGRSKFDYRSIELIKTPLENAEGSAIAKIGKTQVLAGIKIDIAKPFSDRPDEGILSAGCEFTPLAASYFEPGPPRVNSIELARVTDRGIRSSETIDLKKLTIPDSENVIAVYMDLWVMDHGGNLFDAAMLATMSALMNTRMPKIEDGKLIRKETTGKLELSKIVTSCTFSKIGDNHLLDPNFMEETGADGRLTIAVTDNFVCSGQKGGYSAYTQKDIMELVDITFDKNKELKRILEK